MTGLKSSMSVSTNFKTQTLVGIRSSGFNTKYSTKQQIDIDSNKNACITTWDCEAKSPEKLVHPHGKKIASFVKRLK